MTKTTRKLIVFMIMLIIVSLYFVSGTYARYTTALTGNAKVSTANWAVAFKQGDSTITNVTDLKFTVESNPNVVNGKIAPGTTATATINLDLTGTEVAVDYSATITETALKEFFGDDKVTVSVSGEGTVNINDEGTELEEKIVPITISITWDGTGDTDKSLAGKDITLPVTLTVEQHI